MREVARRRVWMTLAAAAVLAVPPAVFPVPAAANTTADTGTPETVHYWNEVLLEAFRRQGGAPAPLARAAAMMHVGIFEVLNSAWRADNGAWNYTYTGYFRIHPADPAVDDDLAAGLAARDLLIAALPDQSSFIAQSFTARHGDHSQPEAEQLAGRVVDVMIDARTGDGSDGPSGYEFDDVPGAWRLTGHLCTEPTTPHWGEVAPFALTTTDQFRQDLPGGHADYADLLASDLYATQFDEVKELGRHDSITRTADQTEIAWFWANDLDGTYKPPGQLLELTKIATQSLLLAIPLPPPGVNSELISAAVAISRVFALVSLALADAGVAAWDEKYETTIDLWRPQSAIQLAGTDGNPDTVADADWAPLSADEDEVRFNPCFPAWVSGHATFAGAWAGIMRTVYGDSQGFTATTEDPHAVGVTREFDNFTHAAEEMARSRVYLGVHFAFDGDDGLATGAGVAGHVSDNYLVFGDCDPAVC